MFPQPATDDLFIQAQSDNSDPVEVRIYTITGRLIQETVTEMRPTLHIDVSRLATGLYILQLKNQKFHAETRISVR